MATESDDEHPNGGSKGGNLRLSTSALNSQGVRVYQRILSPILVIVGIALLPIFIVLLALVDSVDGPHTGTAAVIYWSVVYVWCLLAALLMIYGGIQIPRFGVLVDSDWLTIRGVRTKRVRSAEITAIDIGEARMIRQRVVAPILVMRNGQRIPLNALSIRQAALSPGLPIDRLRPVVDQLRSQIGVHGIEEELPHFSISQ
jgi:hypothetical protein